MANFSLDLFSSFPLFHSKMSKKPNNRTEGARVGLSFMNDETIALFKLIDKTKV